MAQPPPIPPSKPRVLIAEDEPDVLRMISRVIGTFAEVHETGDGQAALEYLQSGKKVDLVITDLMMPRMDGLALVKALKEDESISRIPVIMLTAKGQPRDVVTGINAGARHYLTKPFKQADLIEKVKRALRLE